MVVGNWGPHSLGPKSQESVLACKSGIEKTNGKVVANMTINAKKCL